jgi:hypothetical protein
LARFFVTFLTAFLGFTTARALELALAPRDDFFDLCEADFLAFGEALAVFLAAPMPLPADFAVFLAAGLAPLAIRFTAPAFLDALASTAPIAARIR